MFPSNPRLILELFGPLLDNGSRRSFGWYYLARGAHAQESLFAGVAYGGNNRPMDTNFVCEIGTELWRLRIFSPMAPPNASHGI